MELYQHAFVCDNGIALLGHVVFDESGVKDVLGYYRQSILPKLSQGTVDQLNAELRRKNWHWDLDGIACWLPIDGRYCKARIQYAESGWAQVWLVNRKEQRRVPIARLVFDDRRQPRETIHRLAQLQRTFADEWDDPMNACADGVAESQERRFFAELESCGWEYTTIFGVAAQMTSHRWASRLIGGEW